MRAPCLVHRATRNRRVAASGHEREPRFARNAALRFSPPHRTEVGPSPTRGRPLGLCTASPIQGIVQGRQPTLPVTSPRIGVPNALDPAQHTRRAPAVPPSSAGTDARPEPPRVRTRGAPAPADLLGRRRPRSGVLQLRRARERREGRLAVRGPFPAVRQSLGPLPRPEHRLLARPARDAQQDRRDDLRVPGHADRERVPGPGGCHPRGQGVHRR